MKINNTILSKTFISTTLCYSINANDINPEISRTVFKIKQDKNEMIAKIN